MEKAKIISFISLLGGSGKTVTVAALGHELARNGKKVLLIDLDSMPCLSFTTNTENKKKNIGVIFMDIEHLCEENVSEYIVNIKENLDIIPGCNSLRMINNFVNEKNTKLMQKVIGAVEKDYEYILIDCMPNIEPLVIDAITCSTDVIMTLHCSILSGYALKNNDFDKNGSISEKMLDKKYVITGVDNITQELKQEFEENYNVIASIPFSDSVRPASLMQKGDIIARDPKDLAACAYQELANKL